ncbi:hypothetical protein [Paraburkholderia youngii]|uniref:hypothetical protein n=1 Tax=Paraburkholderia youngii TaxID=2782701 RepID=UPI003D20D9D5
MKSNLSLQAALALVPTAVLKSLVAMAASHIEDIEINLQDHTYSAADNQDLPAKKAALEIAREALAEPMTPEAVVRAREFNINFYQVMLKLPRSEELRPRSAALLAKTRLEFDRTGGANDLAQIESLIRQNVREMEDGAVLGVREDGTIEQWDAERQAAYNSGEKLEEYGVVNLREHELEVACVSRSVWLAAHAELSVDQTAIAARTLDDEFVGARLLDWLEKINAAGVEGASKTS